MVRAESLPGECLARRGLPPRFHILGWCTRVRALDDLCKIALHYGFSTRASVGDRQGCRRHRRWFRSGRKYPLRSTAYMGQRVHSRHYSYGESTGVRGVPTPRHKPAASDCINLWDWAMLSAQTRTLSADDVAEP